MNRTRSTTASLAIGLLALAACGSSKTATPATTVAAVTTTAPAATTAAATTAAPKAAAAAAAPVVALADTSLGKVLVDSKGLTIYMYTKDTQGKPSVCEAACLAAWPAVIASDAGVPVGGPGLTASKLSVIARSDGSKQVAYDGWPLYLFAKDAKPGDVLGQKVGTVWYVLDAAGTIIGK